MKLYQDSGFKWTVASTLILALIFAMSSFSASAGNNPPLANPPSGSTSPTFTNVETGGDVIVGQNVRVGNSIKPKTGTSLALDAEKINFTHALETLGDAIINGTLKTNTIAPISGATVNVNGTIKAGNLWNSGQLSSSKFFLGKFDNAGGLLDNFGGLSFNDQSKSIDLRSTGVASDHVNIEDVGFKSTTITSNDLNFVTPSGLNVKGHLKATSIGDYYFNADTQGMLVKSKDVASVARYCPDKNYQMISCSLKYFDPNPMPTPNIYQGKAHIGNSYIDRTSDPKGDFCKATVWNQYDVAIQFLIQATCFNPNK